MPTTTPTCPFCDTSLELRATQHLEDAAYVTNGAGIGDFECPTGGSRFRYAVVPRFPKAIEHWYLIVDDNVEICLRTAREATGEEARFLWCPDCRWEGEDGVRICPKPHTDKHGRPLPSGIMNNPPLELLRS